MKMIQFRPLVAHEMNLLRKMAQARDIGDWTPTDWHEFRVAYRYQAHRQNVEYTVAMVRLSDGSMLVGATKRNPSDPSNPIRGQVEALRRAFASDIVFATDR